jgi:hypothetical protein
MAKRTIWAIAAVFVTWAILDFILHGVLLQPLYAATSNLWRPMSEMNMGLIYLVTLVAAACFVLIYGLAREKTLKSGTLFGALFGLASGFSMGFGSYAYMPIPLALAFGWFLGTWIEAVIAGAIAGAILKS